MKTVLDLVEIKKEYNPIYKIQNQSELFKAIKDFKLKSKGGNSIICSFKREHSYNKKNYEIDFVCDDGYVCKHITELTSKLGLYINKINDENGNVSLRFRGSSIWCYFLKNKPIYFDISCSLTDRPPHTATFKSKWYDDEKFDRFELLKL